MMNRRTLLTSLLCLPAVAAIPRKVTGKAQFLNMLGKPGYVNLGAITTTEVWWRNQHGHTDGGHTHSFLVA